MQIGFRVGHAANEVEGRMSGQHIRDVAARTVFMCRSNDPLFAYLDALPADLPAHCSIERLGPDPQAWRERVTALLRSATTPGSSVRLPDPLGALLRAARVVSDAQDDALVPDELPHVAYRPAGVSTRTQSSTERLPAASSTRSWRSPARVPPARTTSPRGIPAAGSAAAPAASPVRNFAAARRSGSRAVAAACAASPCCSECQAC